MTAQEIRQLLHEAAQAAGMNAAAIPGMVGRGLKVWLPVADFDALDARLWIESQRRMSPQLFEEATGPPAPAPQPTRAKTVIERLTQAHAATAAQREAQRQPEPPLTGAQVTALNSIRSPTERLTQWRELKRQNKCTEG